MQDDGDKSADKSVASLEIDKDGMRSREELLKAQGYTHLNISLGNLSGEVAEFMSWADVV